MLQGINMGYSRNNQNQTSIHNVETTVTFCGKEIQSNAISKEDHVNCRLEPKGVLLVHFRAVVIL
jgi:hypothetical protein